LTPPEAPDQPTFSHLVELASLPEQGASIVIQPDAKERDAIAARLDLPALPRLRGEFSLRPFSGGVDIDLLLDAEAQRVCVVTLEPMTEIIHEEIAMQFSRDLNDEEIDPDDPIMREPLEGEAIDLGEILVQHLSLSLAPHPRKADADQVLEKYRGAASTSPFAGLKGLIDREN
jgi:hypothetical protein